MKRRPIVPLVCAATLLQAGCGGSGSEETIRVPQLRLGGSGEQTLSLAATERIERRNDAVPVLESASLQREVWVLPRVGDSPACEKLGNASVASDGSSPDEFVLQVDTPPGAAVNPALTLLDELAVAADVSLLVLWSVPAPSTGAEDRPPLLDAAEYALIKGLPPPSGGGGADDGADPEPKNLIYLVEPDDRPAVDGMIVPVAEGTDLPTCAPLDLTRDPDGDGVDTLDELNAGLPIDEVVAGSMPLADGALADEPVDVVVVGRGDRSSGDPLAPTWRVFRPTAPEGSRGGRLELPPIEGDGDPLELRVATASDGSSMLVEAAFPEDYPTSEGALRMDVTVDVPGDGDGEMSFRCLEAFPSRVASLSGELPSEAPTGSPSEGVYLDAAGDERRRLTVRCDSKASVPGGRLSLVGVRVSVSSSASAGDATPVDEVWELRDLELFVHDAPPEPDPTSRS